MSILRRDDVDRFFEHDIHPLKRFLYLGGEIIDDGAAERFLKGMMLLEEQNHEAISVLINSGGGDCYHGLAIYDAIATAKSHVTAVVFGQAMSMAGWILQAADDRVLAPASTLMLHSLSWEGTERTQFMKRWSDEAQRLERLMIETFLRRMKEKDPSTTQRRITKLVTDETYLPADEAVELGLADRILK